MTKQKTEILKNMEFLMRELHKEWDRTGASKAAVTIRLSEVKKMKQVLCREIGKKQKEAEQEDISFRRCIFLSHENYILLRLAEKIRKGEECTNKKGVGYEFTVELDKEEEKLYKGLFGSKTQ